VGIVRKGIVARKAPDHGAKKQQKKTDNTGQYKKYRPGIGPHLLDFRDKAHQTVTTETIATEKRLLGVGVGVDRGDRHKPTCDDGKPEGDRNHILERRPVCNGLDRSHSGTSSQDNVRVQAAKVATPFRKEYSTTQKFATPSD